MTYFAECPFNIVTYMNPIDITWQKVTYLFECVFIPFHIVTCVEFLEFYNINDKISTIYICNEFNVKFDIYFIF